MFRSAILSLTISQVASFSLTTYSDPRTAYEDVMYHPNLNLLPPPTACGEVRAEVIVPYIVEGRSASIGQYPWMALLFKYDHPKNMLDPFCAGSIINDLYILTAAHCCVSNLISVQLGNEKRRKYTDVCNRTETRTGCRLPPEHYKIDHYVRHKMYDSWTKMNDICLVRLLKRIKYNDFVQPICLPIDYRIATHNFDHELLEVAGWGQMDPYIAKPSPVLQSTIVPVIPIQQCKKIHEVTEQNMCAGSSRTGACKGDSGAPLMHEFLLDNTFRHFLIAIVSWGDSVCVHESPTVFVRVSFYMKWVLDNIYL